jgi:molecular chaperone GrpE
MADKDREGKFQITDRRSWLEDESVIDQSRIPETRYPSYVEELKARTELAEQKLKQRLEQLESENDALRRRLERTLGQRLDRFKMDLLLRFLEVADNLERALEAAESGSDLQELRKGVELNLRLFLDRLREAGIEPIEVLNQPFDPHLTEAVGLIPVTDPKQDQRVVEVLQRGYLYGGRLLRPARARVGRLVDTESGGESDSGAKPE